MKHSPGLSFDEDDLCMHAYRNTFSVAATHGHHVGRGLQSLHQEARTSEMSVPAQPWLAAQLPSFAFHALCELDSLFCSNHLYYYCIIPDIHLCYLLSLCFIDFRGRSLAACLQWWLLELSTLLRKNISLERNILSFWLRSCWRERDLCLFC